MPFKTPKYKLDVFGFSGDLYSVSADKRRTQILENQLVSYFDIVGGGVVRGFNVFKGTNPFSIIIEDGLAVVPFEYSRTATVDGVDQKITETHHYGIRHDESVEGEVSELQTSGIFLSANDADRAIGHFSIIISQDLLRNAVTDVESATAYKQYTIEGPLPSASQLKVNFNVFVNSKLQRGGYSISGKTITFSHKRLPTDSIVVRMEPPNSLLIAIVVSNNEGVVSIDNSVRVDLRQKFGDDLVADDLRKHHHTGTAGQPSKVALTTSTNYATATAQDDKRTTYNVAKASLIQNTGMDGDWAAINSTSLIIDGTRLTDNTQDFTPRKKADSLKGYYINPNTAGKVFLNVISNSQTTLITDDNIEEYASAGDPYLLVPYRTIVAVNGQEENYGYHLISDDNTTITIRFDGSLEESDIVDVKLIYTRHQSEITGTIEVESDSVRQSLARSINFAGENIKTGLLNPDRMPDIDHIGRNQELMIPFVSDFGDAETGWKTDTVDGYVFRPRTDEINSLRDVMWIHKQGNKHYICANDTILRADTSRLYGHVDYKNVGYADCHKPVKIIEQGVTGDLYAFNSNMILRKAAGVEAWDEFVNLTEDVRHGSHPDLTILNAEEIYDLCSDSTGLIYVATDNGMFMFDRQLARSKQWYKISEAKHTAIGISEFDSEYHMAMNSVFGNDNDGMAFFTDMRPKKITTDTPANTSKVKVSSTSGIIAGDILVITDLGVATPEVGIVDSVTSTEITFTAPLTRKYSGGRAYIIASPEAKTDITGILTRGIIVNKDGEIALLTSTLLYPFTQANLSNGTDPSTQAIPSSHTIIGYGKAFSRHYLILAGSSPGLYALGSVWTRITNTSYYTDLPLSGFQYILGLDDELYIGAEDGIYQCSTDSSTSAELILRPSSLYLMAPLNITNNVFKNRLIKGVIGYVEDDTRFLTTGQRQIYVSGDLASTVVGDYLYITETGGGATRVNKYLRILGITAISKSKKQYRLAVDWYDGVPLASSVIYGMTFIVVPKVNPLPIIDGIPQSATYTSNTNSFSVSYARQSISFSEKVDYSSDVTIATGFSKFVPKRGSWGADSKFSVYLNGRDITDIKGTWASITSERLFNSEFNSYDNKTKLTAKNRVFRGLNLTGRTITVNTTSSLAYEIESNDEASIIIAGNHVEAITNSGATSASEIEYTMPLVTAVGDDERTAIQIISPLSSEDTVRITVLGTFIQDAGNNSHSGIEDSFSEEEVGLPHKLDAARTTNLLQLYSEMKKFVSNLPDQDNRNLKLVRFLDTEAIDLVNSTIANTKIAESVEAGKVSYTVYGLLYSELYGGMYALTENGVFFRANASGSRWNRLSDFVDTISPVGSPTIDDENPAGVYISYDKDADQWTVAWGGFHESEERNSGLNNIVVTAIAYDTDNWIDFYIGTKSHGLLKSEGGEIRSILNNSAFKEFSGTDIKEIIVDPINNSLIHLVTKSGLYRSIDRGESFECIVKAEEVRGNASMECAAVFRGDGNDFRTFCGGTSLYSRTSDQDLDSELRLKFTKMLPSDLTFEDEFNFIIRDIAVSPVDSNIIVIATNNGIYRTTEGVGLDYEFNVASAYDAFESGVVYSYITVTDTITSSELPAGTFILPSKIYRNGRSFEVVSLTNSSGTTTIKVKGNAVRSTENPQVKPGDTCVVKRWAKITSGLADFDVNSITFNSDGSNLYCGTATSGVFTSDDLTTWSEINYGLPVVDDTVQLNVSKIRCHDGIIYIALRDIQNFGGGLFSLGEGWSRRAGLYSGDIKNGTITDGLDSHDVLSFSISNDSGKAVIGTSNGVYSCVNFDSPHATWERVSIPSDSVLSLEWTSQQNAFAGTEGMGIFYGVSLGKQWKQRFSSASIVNEIKSMYWRVLGISQDHTDDESPLRVTVQSLPSDPSFYDSKNTLSGLKKVEKNTGDFEWEKTDDVIANTNAMLWLDPANYPYLSRQTGRTNSPDKCFGTTFNKVIRNPLSSEIVLGLLNDHQVVSGDSFSVNYGNDELTSFIRPYHTLNRQGGAFLAEGNCPVANDVTRALDPRVSSPRNFAVKSIARTGTDGEVIIGTESAGIFKVTQNEPDYNIFFGTGVLANAGSGLKTLTDNGGFNKFTDLSVGSYVSCPSVGVNGFVTSVAPNSITFSTNDSSNGTCNYVVSELWIHSINGETDEDAGAVSDAVFGTDAEDPLKDTLLIASSRSIDPSELIGRKLFADPLDDATTYVISDAILSSETSPDADYMYEVKVGSSDIAFASGDYTANVIAVYYLPATGHTSIKINPENANLPLSYLFQGNERIQANVGVKKLYRGIFSLDTITIPDADGAAYASITSNGTVTSGFDLRINAGIATRNVYPKIPLIVPDDMVVSFNEGLESYISDYTDALDGAEYTCSVNKLLLVGTTVFASISPVGIMTCPVVDGGWTSIADSPKVIFDFDVNDDEFIVATDRNAIYYKRDGTFVDVTLNLAGEKINAVKFAGGYIFVTTEKTGVYYSPESATITEWIRNAVGIEVNTVPQWNFAINPSNDSQLYAYGMGAGVFFRVSGHFSGDPIFEPRNKGLLNTSVVDLAVDGSTLYAATATGGIYKSTNAGVSWNKLVTAGFDSQLIRNVAVIPGSPNTVLAVVERDVTTIGFYTFAAETATGVFRSTDGGSSWTRVLGIETTPGLSSDLSAYTDAVFVGAKGGIYRSTDAGLTFEKVYSMNSFGMNSIFKTKGKNNEVFAHPLVMGNGGGFQASETLISFDNGSTWVARRYGGAVRPEARAASEVFSIPGQNVVIDGDYEISGSVSYSPQTGIRDVVSLSSPHILGDFEGATVTIHNQHNSRLTVGALDSIFATEGLSSYTNLPVPGLQNVFVENGTPFTLSGISKILIENCDTLGGLVLPMNAWSAYTGLYIKVGANAPLRIAQYAANGNDVTFYVIGSLPDTTSVRTIVIGPLVNDEIEPITRMFVPSVTGSVFDFNAESAFGISLNYLRSVVTLDGSIALRKTPDTDAEDADAYSPTIFKAVWETPTGSTDEFNLIRDGKFFQTDQSGYYTTVIEGDSLPSSLNGKKILTRGVSRTATRGYLSTTTSLFVSNAPESNTWTEITNNSYISGSSVLSFSSISQPLIIAPSDENVAYLIVDDDKLLRTTVLQALVDGAANALWYLRTLSPTGISLGSKSIRKFAVHPTNSEIVFMCVENPTNITAPENGLWMSINAGGSWTKLFVNALPANTSVTDISFLNTTGTQIMISVRESDGTPGLYTNVFGIYGSEALGAIKTDIGYLVATEYGTTWINTNSTGSHDFSYAGGASVADVDTYFLVSHGSNVKTYSKEKISSDILESFVKTTSFPNGVTVNRIVSLDAIYFCTTLGLYSCASALDEPSIVTGTESLDIKDVDTDYEGTLWVATNNNVLRISGDDRTVFAKPFFSPKSICFVPGATITLGSEEGFILAPPSGADESVLVVKTFNAEAIDQIVDGDIFDSAIFTTSTLFSYDEELDQTVITVASNSLGSDNEQIGKALVLDGDYSTIREVVSSNANSITVSGEVTAGSRVAIHQYVGSNDLVLYDGSQTTRYFIEDLSVSLGQNYRYYIYYRDSVGKIYPAYELRCRAGQSNTSQKVLVGTQSEIAKLEPQNSGVTYFQSFRNVEDIRLDSHNGILVAHAEGAARISDFSNEALSVPSIQYNEIREFGSEFILSGVAGVYVVNDDGVESISHEFATYDYTSIQRRFVKVWGESSAYRITNTKQRSDSGVIYAALGGDLLVSRERWFGWKQFVLEGGLISDIVFGNSTLSAVVVTPQNSYYMLGTDFTPQRIFFKKSNEFSTTASVQSYDGQSLFIAPDQPYYNGSGEMQFMSFRMNANPLIDFIVPGLVNESVAGVQNSDSAFISGAGLLANSNSGVFYGGTYAIGSEGSVVWVGSFGGIHYATLDDITDGGAWTSVPSDSLFPVNGGYNGAFGYYNYNPANFSTYVPVAFSSSVNENRGGVYVNVIANHSNLMGDIEPLRRNKYDTITRSAVHIFHLALDGPDVNATHVSSGFFSEKDLGLVVKSSTRWDISREPYLNNVKSRTPCIDFPSNMPRIFVGNNFGELENIYRPVVAKAGDGLYAFGGSYIADAGYKLGFKSWDSCSLPNNADRGSFTDVESLKALRPFRASAGAFDPSNPENIFVAIFNPGETVPYSTTAIAVDSSELLVTKDGGINWFSVTMPVGRINDIAIDPTDSDKVYVAIAGSVDSSVHGVYKSINGGISFSKVSGSPAYPCVSVSTSLDGSILYAGFLGAGIHSYSGSWTQITPRFTQRTGLGITSGTINDIDVNDYDPKVIRLATKDNGVLKSVDGGINFFFDVDGLPSGDCTAIRTSPIDPAMAWVGTDSGLYYRDKVENKWVLSPDIPSGTRINAIEVNEFYKKSLVTLTYRIPTYLSNGILILRREGEPVTFEPTNNVIYDQGAIVSDGSYVVYSGDIPANEDGLVELVDTMNVKPGIEYFYEFFYHVDQGSDDVFYIRFPALYTNEVFGFTGDTITIQAITGTVTSAKYREYTNITEIVDSTKTGITSFGSHLVGKKIQSDVGQVEIKNAYGDTLIVEGDFSHIDGEVYEVLVTMVADEFKDCVLNPNVDQLLQPTNEIGALLFPIKGNSETMISIRNVLNGRTINEVPGMHTPDFAWFEDRYSIKFAVLSTKQVVATHLNPIYVLTEAGIYTSIDNGKSFTLIDTITDNVREISFVGDDPIRDLTEIKGWIAGEAGLYYGTGNFSTIENYGDGCKFVDVDPKNSEIVYVFRDGVGMQRSVNGGESFETVDVPLNSEVPQKIIFRSDYTNHFLCGTEDSGVVLFRDSVRDIFEIDLETDQKFSLVNFTNFKIGDSVKSDANSIHIRSTVKANALNDQINELQFKTDGGKYVRLDVQYNETRAYNDLVHVGEYGTNPASVPLRLRIPGSVADRTIGFSLTLLPDNTLAASTSRGAYLSRDGQIWSKIDNFLIPDMVYTVARLKNGMTYLGTNNGTWINRDNNLVDFVPKDQIGRKVRALWSYKSGNKTVTFSGGEEGLRIRYENFPEILVTTPENFTTEDGVMIGWGAENDNGIVNPGGLDSEMLADLNATRLYDDPCSKNTGLVNATGWAGTVLVRWEGGSDSGFEPLNSVVYESKDRRYVNSVRGPKFDIGDDGEQAVFGFPDGLVIVDNIKTAVDRETEGVDAPGGEKDQDTFTADNPFYDRISISPEDDRSMTYGAFDGENDPQGAELKPNTSYYYTMFAYYLRPPNFVFEFENGGCRWIPIYRRVKVREWHYRIPISQMPNAKTVTCGLALSEYEYLVGTDDGAFFASPGTGFRKASGTDNNVVNCMSKVEDKIFIGTNTGIFVSDDDGVSYTRVFTNSTNGIRNVFSIAFNGSDVVYAGTDRGIFVKDSGDDTIWTFESLPGSAEAAQLGTYIGQDVTF